MWKPGTRIYIGFYVNEKLSWSVIRTLVLCLYVFIFVFVSSHQCFDIYWHLFLFGVNEAIKYSDNILIFFLSTIIIWELQLHRRDVQINRQCNRRHCKFIIQSFFFLVEVFVWDRVWMLLLHIGCNQSKYCHTVFCIVYCECHITYMGE